MFCSGCGQSIESGQTICPRCNRPLAPPLPPIPGLQFELESYAGKVKVLSILWFAYAALSFLLGVAGLTFAKALFSGGLSPWMHSPVPPMWMGPAFLNFVWVMLALRAALAAVAAWGLMERTQWGRLVAIVVAILSLIKFPFGTALGIWTLVLLLGYRNSTLYEQL